MYIGLQVARGIAALFVVLHHTSIGSDVFYNGKAILDFWTFGRIGVDFFFVLSGFIIYWAHSNDTETAQSAFVYLKKRLIRIYPPFILISIILLIAYAAFPSLSIDHRNIGVITSLLLVPTPPLEPALLVSWTLMHEMLFYLLFMLFYIKKQLLFFIFLLWALLILTVSFTPLEGLINVFFLNPHNLQFLLGISAALILKNNQANSRQLVIGLCMLFFYIFYLEKSLLNMDHLLHKIYLGICFMLIVTGLCSIESKIDYPSYLVAMGAASYSIYLIHNPVISLLSRVAAIIQGYFSLAPELLFTLIAGLSVLAGYLYYLMWERPMIKKLRNLYLTS